MAELTADSFGPFFGRFLALLTAGTPEHYNSMTIGWGGAGTLWGKPVVTLYVRPDRYTYDFMEESEYCTVSFYPASQNKNLMTMGTVSGRDHDKAALTGMTPKAVGNTVTYEEAERTLVCRKLYAQDLDPALIPEDVMTHIYRGEPTHRMYIAEVVDIL